ncbi:MAG: hypothetical protein K0R00_48 [Herbinix sp.]|nr:hypothetical protein [Herbinix sp.]
MSITKEGINILLLLLIPEKRGVRGRQVCDIITTKGRSVVGVDKVVHYENEIYKEALTASKAHEIAKKVRLVPDGNWKWALRKLRDRKGNALAGRELAEAKMGLGDVSNNAYQKIKSTSRKLPSETELAALIDKGEVKAIKTGPVREHRVDSRINNNSTYSNLHTHPINEGERKIKELQEMRTVDRIVGEIEEIGDTPKNQKKIKEIRRITDEHSRKYLPKNIKVSDVLPKNLAFPKRNHLITDMSGGISRYNGVSGDLTKKRQLTHLEQGSKRSPEIYDKLQRYKETHYPLLNNDVAAAIKESEILGEKNRIERIINPNQDYIGVHKVTPYTKRSIFFDKSPRKA